MMVKRIGMKVLISLMLTYKQMVCQLVEELTLPLQQGLHDLSMRSKPHPHLNLKATTLWI